MNPSSAENPDRACAAGGKFGAVEFDGEALCVDCYAERGSRCSPAEDEQPED